MVRSKFRLRSRFIACTFTGVKSKAITQCYVKIVFTSARTGDDAANSVDVEVASIAPGLSGLQAYTGKPLGERLGVTQRTLIWMNAADSKAFYVDLEDYDLSRVWGLCKFIEGEGLKLHIIEKEFIMTKVLTMNECGSTTECGVAFRVHFEADDLPF